MDKLENYKEIARQSRVKCLELVFKAQTSHIGSLMSCADIMAVLFGKVDLDRDKFILSAGWKVCMLYYHLWRKGRITKEELDSYCHPGSKFIGLAEPIIPEIPAAGGSMGFGLPFGVGFALAKKLKKEKGKVFVLMSDGEMQCGTTWESALIASHQRLNNLFVVVDANELQAMGKVKEILNIEPL
ncbi:MAG: 1-deoxy-D-xylulose-5-phosphate synthase N-terminal domain-containing protein, partial [Ignavibacteria bacterium]|nr:1-deoxy-D-xylulose-5-phosphate synthase N-terminal domain-containing protein [Ignavibacteria bacterium]